MTDQRVIYFAEVQDGAGSVWHKFDTLKELEDFVDKFQNTDVFGEMLEVSVVREFGVSYTVVPKKAMEWKNYCEREDCMVTGPHLEDKCRGIRVHELVTCLVGHIYPTTQIVTGETTAEDYVRNLAILLVNEPDEEKQKDELIGRRIYDQHLPHFLELGGLLREQSDSIIDPRD